MFKYSKANNKLKKLYDIPQLANYLSGKRKVYSYDSGLSGFTCPFAKDCMAKVKIVDGKKKLFDGPHTQFRCFSASQEALYPTVYDSRQRQFNALKTAKTTQNIATLLINTLPDDAGIVRINVAGDIFSQAYFDAIILAANSSPVLWYAYTKSLPFWVKRLDSIPDNLVLTASYGGTHDHLINKYGLRSAKVVHYQEDADKLGLEIDDNDSHAARPDIKTQDFALLIHGVQPSGTDANTAIQFHKQQKRNKN